jgi:predicted O-methyltransferase YrrM
MDKAVTAVLKEYETRMEQESALWRDDPGGAFHRRDEMLLPVGRATAELMTIIIAASKPRTILEIGTSYGYSTLWLGEAAKNAGGTLHTLEIAQHKSDYARERIERAGLAESVVFHVGEARELIAAMKGPIDFVLLDLWKDLYIPCFDLVYPKLSKGAFVVADNMIDPPPVRADAERYRKHIKTKPGITSILLPVGSGIEVSRFD